jgi:glyoxylase-like metal-dependent hydrolase (beta-lactamase superfamily II)
MREITPGLRYWTAPHPEWRGAADWPEEVGCVYYEAPDATVLIDPLIPKSDEDELWATLDAFVERLGLPVAVLLTAPWHARSASEIAERLRVCPSPACSDDEALDFRRSLRTLLDLPIDHVLVSHGEPVINEGRSRIAEALGIDA